MRRKAQATPEELKAIQEAMANEKKVRVYKRYQALYLYLSGKKRQEVAEIVGLTPRTISELYSHYLVEGLEGLVDKPIPGRPSRLSEKELEELKSVIIYQRPLEVGFPEQMNWTAQLIGKYIFREYGLSYSIRGITGMLKRMGFSYIRHTYSLTKASSSKQTSFAEEFD